MRQRRLKNLDERIEELNRFLCGPFNRGRWRDLFGADEKTPLYLEIGCGKGAFITEHAARNPKSLYVAVEGHESVVLRALEKAGERDLSNLRIVIAYVHDLTECFSENELCGIYLNFSDPWPKDRHAKRRLTHRGYLEMYKKVVRPGGFVAFKTDNDDMFSFSVSEAEGCGMNIVKLTGDLHNSEYRKGQVMTEYEKRFTDLGEKINYMEILID